VWITKIIYETKSAVSFLACYLITVIIGTYVYPRRYKPLKR